MDWQVLADTPLQSEDELRRLVTDRAVSDVEFRNLLVSNPKEAISQELGLEMPEEYQVVVHENDAQTFHLSLPVTELDEEQLEAIAAGRCCC